MFGLFSTMFSGAKNEEQIASSDQDQNETTSGVETENIEVLELEWSLELGEMTCPKVAGEIEQLNKNLKEVEKRWRLPTIHELQVKFGRNFLDYWSKENYPSLESNDDITVEKLILIREVA